MPWKRAVPVILVVDDDPSDRALAVRAVAQACPGARVLEAGDGFEAGHRAATEHPDLVVLDLHMLGVDGFRVCQLIRSDPGMKDTRVLAISGFDQEPVRESIMDIGADAFLSKNAGWSEMGRRAAELLGGGGKPS